MFKQSKLKKFYKDSSFPRLINLCLTINFVFMPTLTWGQSNTQQNIQMGVQTLQQGLQTYQQQNQQMQQQMQSMQRQNSIMQATTPMTPQNSFPDELLSNCIMSKAESSHVEGMCEDPPSSPIEAEEFRFYIQRSRVMKEHYHQMWKTGVKSRDKTMGVACLEKEADAVSKNFHAQEMFLKGKIEQVKAEAEMFKKEAQARLNKIKDIQAELTGQGEATQDLKHKDFASLLNNNVAPACKAVFTQSKASSLGQTGGFRGLKQQASKYGLDDAQKLLTSSRQIEKEIRKDVKKFLQKAQSAKPAEVLKTEAVSKSPAFKAALNEVRDKFNDEHGQISERLNNMKFFSMPNLNNKGQLNRFLKKDLMTEWRDDYVQKCMSDDSGLNVNNILAQMEQKGTSGQGSRLSNFNSRVGNLFNQFQQNQISLETFYSELKKLDEGQKGVISVNLRSPFAGRKSNYEWSISELTKELKNKCVSDFQHKKSPDGTLTWKGAAQQAQRDLTAMRDFNKNFAAQAQSKILNKLLHCEDVSYTQNPDYCNPKKLNYSQSDSFCMKQSLACAKDIDNCHSQINNIVRQKEADMRQLAKVHNDSVAQYKKKQNRFLQGMVADFMKYAEPLKKLIPNVKYDLPSDLMITEENPKLMQGFEVALSDTDNFAEKLEKKLQELKQNMEKQHKLIEQQTKKHIADSREMYIDEEEYWKGEAEKCNSKLLAWQNQMKQQQQKEAKDYGKQQQEEQSDIADLCRLSSTMQSMGGNIRPGCDGVVDDLVETGNKIFNILSPDDQKLLNSYNAFCLQNSSDKPSDDTTIFALRSFCDRLSREKPEKEEEKQKQRHVLKLCYGPAYDPSDLESKEDCSAYGPTDLSKVKSYKCMMALRGTHNVEVLVGSQDEKTAQNDIIELKIDAEDIKNTGSIYHDIYNYMQQHNKENLPGADLGERRFAICGAGNNNMASMIKSVGEQISNDIPFSPGYGSMNK